LQCLPVGWYSLQVMGQMQTGSNLFSCYNDLGKDLKIRVRAFSVPQYNTFSLRNPVASHIGNFNSGNPLNGDTDRFQNQMAAPDYNAVQDQFGCGSTALPADYTDCSGHSSIKKAMYRTFVIPAGKTGFIRAWNLNTWDFRYRLYSGNAASFVGAGINIPPSPDPTTFTGLTPVTACGWNGSEVCVGPGTYTLVTFGDADDVGDTDQPTIEFDWIDTEYDRNLSHLPAVDVLNSGNPLVSTTSYTAALDVFDCDQSVMPPNVCNNTPAFDRAIYRQFVINDYGTIDIHGTCGTTYRLYAGNALTSGVSGNTLTGLTPHSECFTGVIGYYCTNYCGLRCNTQGASGCKYDRICVTPGTYTLVAFGNGNMVGKIDQPVITFTARHNKFSLTNTPNPAPPNPANNRVDLINSGNPLAVGVTYNSVYNEFDCYPTVLPHPASSACKPSASYPAMDRAMYRVLQVNTSGILTISGLGVCPQSCSWHPGLGYRFYKGNAQALANAQGVNTAGQTISGLVDLIGCDCNRSTAKVCVEPGYYTLVTFGFDEMRGYGDQPSFRLDQPTTLFHNPASPDNMGTINTTTSGTPDVWTCMTNAVTVGSGSNARTPCNVGSPAAPATKAIYRIFTLSQPRHLTISVTNGVARLFTGHSTSGLAGLVPYSDCTGEWACFSSKTTDVCCLMPAGNYTLVIYGYGPDYNTGPPQYTSGSGQQLGEITNVTITIHTAPPAPQYYAPHLASNQGVTDYHPGHGLGTPAYPETRKEYIFNIEWFDCSTQSTSNIAGPCTSPSGINRTAYYRFQLTNESYIRIRNIPSSMGVQIYKQDPYTAPSPNFPIANRIHDCIRRFDYLWCHWSGTWIGEIEICRLEPGVYTMILFATNAHIYTSVQPIMVVEQVRTSKFDFASQAYDFGVIPGYGDPLNNTEIFQKVGESTWFTGRPNSNDFFTCKTGAFRRDPGIYDDGLWQTPDYSDGLANNEQGTYRNFVPTTNPNPTVPYPMPLNYVVYEKYSGVDTTTVPIRRNLWYTFVLQGSGTCYVRVYPKTTSQTRNYP
ncbi:MAG: hypothetical protein RMM53_07410, partial [Bacteroidia bacterium]|nr:hypothetical protein [Bacteroidia bacterium]